MRVTHRVATIAFVAIVVAAAALPCRAHAQVRASERATISQTSDGTIVTIDYARPRARGRANLFGGVVKWGEIWTPGANWATTLLTNRDITIDEHKVPKGKYSVWFVVQQNEWTVILDPRFQRYHEDRPDSIAKQIRWKIKPTTGESTEILTWTFPEVRPDGAQLRFAWGTTRVDLNIGVRASHPLTITRAAAEPFLGVYKWKWTENIGIPSEITMTLYYDDGMLKQKYDPAPDWYPLLQDQPMVRINDSWFIPAIVRDGKVWEMDSDMVFEFDVKTGKARTFELRDSKDELLGKGARAPGSK